MDQLRAMMVYRRVADRGSFTAASADLGLARGAASAIVAQLEKRLGVQLIERTTRQLRLTEDGQHFLERASQILDELRELEEEVGSAERHPRGRLRVQMPPGLARLIVAPALPEFYAAYPDVKLELLTRNGVPDFVGGNIDAAIVLGDLPELDISTRTIGRIPSITVAAPAYLAERGSPATPDDLINHECIGLLSTGPVALLPWRFSLPDGDLWYPIDGRLAFEGSDPAVVAAVRGLGILQLASYLVFEQVRGGKLVTILDTFRPKAQNLSIVHPRHRLKPRKLRVFEEFLARLEPATRNRWGVEQID